MTGSKPQTKSQTKSQTKTQTKTLTKTQTKTLTKTQRLARAKLARNMLLLNSESWLPAALREDIPEAWHTLEADLDVEEPKEKVTLYLDQSVARFYRAMGKGYHARINRLLATWAQMKIADELRLEKALAVRR